MVSESTHGGGEGGRGVIPPLHQKWRFARMWVLVDGRARVRVVKRGVRRRWWWIRCMVGGGLDKKLDRRGVDEVFV